MFLANRIIAHASSKEQRFKAGAQIARAVKDNFKKSAQDQGMDPESAKIFSAGMAMSVLDLPFFADKIRQAMRFAIDEKIVPSIQKMQKTSDEVLIKAYKYARLPYPITWIEGEEEADGAKLGWLLEQDEKYESIRIYGGTAVKSMGFIPLFNKQMSVEISADGIQLNGITPEFQQNYIDAYRIILLLNSRSGIFKVGEAEQEHIYHRDKLRKKFGALPFVNIQPIELDIARVMKKHGVGTHVASQLLVESLVMGHFKVRETGVFWWSPHVRNPMGSTKEGLLSHKDRNMTDSSVPDNSL